MAPNHIAGYLLIAAFVFVLLASLIGPNQVYTARDKDTRLQIIRENSGRWTATNLVWAAGTIVSAVGIIYLTISLLDTATPSLLIGASVLWVIAALAWAIFLYQRISDPAGNLYTTPPAIASVIFAWTGTIGLGLYGLVLITGGYPAWVGYSTLVGMGLLLLGLIFAFDVVYTMFPPQYFNLFLLLMGIAALRQ